MLRRGLKIVGPGLLIACRVGSTELAADTVVVTPPGVVTLEVEPILAAVQVGKAVSLSASASDGSRPAIGWSVSDGSIAYVGQSGVVSGLEPGSVVVTVTTAREPKKSATATVTVVPRDSTPCRVRQGTRTEHT